MTMSSYLHNKDNRKDIHNDSNFFESMVNRIYSSELQLKKASVSDIEASFLDLCFYILEDFVTTKMYDKRDNLVLLFFPFLW